MTTNARTAKNIESAAYWLRDAREGLRLRMEEVTRDPQATVEERAIAESYLEETTHEDRKDGSQ
jgi:hypothetical protein